MDDQKISEKYIRDLKNQLNQFQAQHEELLKQATQLSPHIGEIYNSIWGSEERLLKEIKLVREMIRISDYLLYCPKS